MIEYSDLEFFERVGEGLTATVWRGRWKSEDMLVAVKKMEEMTNREVEICALSQFRCSTTINSV